MKKLFVIGFGQCFASIIPVLIWTLTGKLYGDAFVNGMTFTYPYQFLFSLIWNAAFVGSIKFELKKQTGHRNYSQTGILVGTAAGIMLIGLSLRYRTVIAPFLGVTTDIDQWAFLFGLCSMGVDWPALFLGELHSYYGDEKKGTRFIITWYLVKFILVCVTVFPVFNHKTASVFVLSVQSVILILLLWHARPQKLQFAIISSIRHTAGDLVYYLFMLLIYLFGIHDMSVADRSMLAAFNLMTLCTDMQWDVCDLAIDVTVTGSVCDGTFDRQKRKIFLHNAVFSMFMAASSFVMLGLMLVLYRDVNPVPALVYMIIELSAMIPCSICDTMSAYVNIRYPGMWMAMLVTYRYSVRLAAQILISSPYAISIALPISVVAGVPFLILLYRKAGRTA